MRVLTVLACVRTPDAARAISVCADRLGVSASVRTAVTAVEAIARLAERPADLVFVDGPLTRPDPVGFVRRAMAYAPAATLVVYGLPEPSVASALISAGARGVIRGGDTDLVTAVAKTVLLLGLTDGVGIGVAVPAKAVEARRPAEPRRPELNGAVARPNPPRSEHAPLPDRLSSALDTRNGGPGYSVPRSVPAAGIDSESMDLARSAALTSAMSGSAGRGALPALVPQQRMDFPATAVRPPPLTERELQVLRGMADGKSNAEIGRELFVSEDTVKTHARRLFRKLGARDRAHAVASGFRTGLVG